MSTEELLDYLEWAVNNEIPLEEMCRWTGESSKRIGANITSLRTKGRLKPKYIDGKYYCVHCGKYLEVEGFYSGKIKTRFNPLGLRDRCIKCSTKPTDKEHSKEHTKEELFGKTRVCTVCCVEKEIEEFHWKNKKEELLDSRCRQCASKKNKESKIKMLKERGY